MYYSRWAGHTLLSCGSLALGAAAVSAGTTREALWGRAQLLEACGTTFNNLRAANGSHLFARYAQHT